MLECIPDILTPAEIETVLAGMSDTGYVDGAKTAGFRAKRVKHNEQLGRNAASRETIDKLIISALRRNKDFQRVALPRTMKTPLFSRYREGMSYGLHVDDAAMGPSAMRTDVSVTVFLNQPDQYDGGALEIQSAFGAQQVKLPAGAAVVYPSSTLHQVLPVTRGERLAAVTWVESKVRDPNRREILADIDRIRRKLHADDASSPEADAAFKTYANLLRMWME